MHRRSGEEAPYHFGRIAVEGETIQRGSQDNLFYEKFYEFPSFEVDQRKFFKFFILLIAALFDSVEGHFLLTSECR